MRMYDIICKKRDGNELHEEEINFWVREYTNGNIPDYQISALLMAIFFQGLTHKETYHLTKAMMLSGDTIDLSEIKGIKVDKHSTGGVGDTTTLIVGPLVATCGIPVAKISGRGLGHTGGTIDKLEAIPGFQVEMPIQKFIDTVNQVKLSILSQSTELAPADKKIYALRDVTATVENISLISSSIMSKKLAAGCNKILLDVKVGNGAFMKSLDNAIELAKNMVNIGTSFNRETVAILSNMDQPLGYAVGNALEIKEAIQTLKNKGPKDLTKLCIYLAAHMIYLAKLTETFDEALNVANKKLVSGEAFAKFKEFIGTQGGNVDVVTHPNKLPTSQYIFEVKATSSGYVNSIETEKIGLAALILGAGRENKKSHIDLSAGLVLNKKISDKVEINDIIATLYTNRKESIHQAANIIANAYSLSVNKTSLPSLIHGIVTKDYVKLF